MNIVFYKKNNNKIKNRGFTVVELLVSVVIFAFMTAFLVSKYGSFNQSVLLTNLAYDVALTIRNAQSYGLNVKSKPTAGENFSSDFSRPYGVYFNSGISPLNTSMIFFADVNANGIYDDDTIDCVISTYKIKRGSIVSFLCVGSGPCSSSPSPSPSSSPSPGASTLNISFKRPNPNAIIKSGSDTYNYADITLRATDGSTRKVVIRQTGQIEVK